MISHKYYSNDLLRVFNWYAKYGLKVIPVNYNDMSETISPYEFYFLEPPDKATSDYTSIRKISQPFTYWAVKVGSYIDIITVRVVESEGGIESLQKNENLSNLLNLTATIKTPFGFDYLVKVDHQWLVSQIEWTSYQFFEFKGFHPGSLLYEYVQMDIKEKPYYQGHRLKQIAYGEGIYLILDGFIIIPPSQWYIWKHQKSIKNLSYLSSLGLKY